VASIWRGRVVITGGRAGEASSSRGSAGMLSGFWFRMNQLVRRQATLEILQLVWQVTSSIYTLAADAGLVMHGCTHTPVFSLRAFSSKETLYRLLN
jgi:hypothetical protein